MVEILVKEYYIPPQTVFVFVADFFIEDYVGGAELTTQALFDVSPCKAFKIHASSLTEELLEKNKDKHFIFGNWTQISFEAISYMYRNNMKFSFIVYDYCYCQYRNPTFHQIKDKNICSCNQTKLGKIVAGLYTKAHHVFYMSKEQKNIYEQNFPVLLKTNNSSVLSSVWSISDLEYLQKLREETKPEEKKNVWAVLKGGSWVKGQEQTEQYCKQNNIKYELLGGLEYKTFLKELSKYYGIVYHAAGLDTAPRYVIEAKILGLNLDLNDLIQHYSESWFVFDIETCVKYLTTRSDYFWNICK